uniref:Uncharacterized protein n=1 Tax=Anguilla anguilla TaxID=7936 RepID=A0A0E9V7A6_ANGAN
MHDGLHYPEGNAKGHKVRLHLGTQDHGIPRVVFSLVS